MNGEEFNKDHSSMFEKYPHLTAHLDHLVVENEMSKEIYENILKQKDEGMAENELSEDQFGSLFDACKSVWTTMPDDMAGKVWAGGPRLKPCPFCGSDAKMCHGHSHYYARCTNPECLVRTRRYSDVTEAIKAWNRRVSK